MATITAHDDGRADAALVQRFRQSQTTLERTAMFADVVRQHRHAVLCSCAERLWPDADAAVDAAAGVLVAARLAMADSTKLQRPDRLRDWLLGIAAQARPMPGQPARIGDVNWETVRARIAVGSPETLDSPARLAWLRQWLERIVGTLPEPRQRMYDLLVTRGLDNQNAARELGTTVAEVRRLRRENRQAILRAFEVTALAAAETAANPPRIGAPECVDVPQILADARSDGDDPRQDGRRYPVVLPAALRLTLSRHLSQCRTCQDRRDDRMAQWAPELLPILADAELYEQVMEDVRSMPELRQPGAHRRVATASTARTARKVVIGRAAAAAGAGLLAALLLLAFVWPGILRGPRAATDASSPNRNKAATSGAVAPTVAGTADGAPDDNHGRPARQGAAGVLSSLPPVATGSSAAPSSASAQPSVYYTLPPSTGSTSSPTQPTPTPSPSSSHSRTTSPTPSPSAPTPTPTPSASSSTPTPTPTTSTPTPTPTASTSTPTPTTSASTPTPTPSASTSEPAPTTSASASSPTSASPEASSTAAPSASATT